MKNVNKWDSLSIKDKADLMKLYIKNGIKDLDSIKRHFNSFEDGGHTGSKTVSGIQKPYYEIPESTRRVLKGLAMRNRDKEALFRLGYDERGNSIAESKGGKFGGSGAGGFWNTEDATTESSDYIRNTPILRSFSDAFSEARKQGLSTFMFNNQEYTTDISDNPNYIGKRYEPKLNLREVLDENKKVISDSTRVEPYLGQIPGTHKRNKFENGGVRTLVDKSNIPIYDSWETAVNSWPIEQKSTIDYDEIKRRQRWAESQDNPNARSLKGAKGLFQVMPSTHKEYVAKTGNRGNIYDPKYNTEIRDWYMQDMLNSRTITNGNPTDSVQLAKQLAAYNWGRGNLGSFLEKQKKAGTDIYNTLDWIDSMPKEPRDYVNFILRNKDTGGPRMNELYNKKPKIFLEY